MKEPKRSSALVRRETFASYCFLLPSLIFFLGFVIYPMILCVVTSFFDSTMNRADIFVGMANYKTLFADPIFLGALKNTFVIVIVSVPITCIFSLWVSFALSELPAVDLHEMSNAPQGDLGSAMIYYAFDNTVNSSRYPYYSYMKGFWTAMGLHTRIDTTVTVSDLKRMNDYGLCILSAHGSYYTYTSGFLFKQTRTEPVILLTEESDFYKDLYYGIDLLTHRVIKINGLYCITPSFFQAAYRGGQLKDTVVLSETCEFLGVSGSLDTSMADALLAGGAKAVAGYVNNVYTVYSRSMLWDTVNHLILGQTLQESVQHSMDTYGADDLVWYNAQGGKRPHAAAAYPLLFGDVGVRLIEPNAAPAPQEVQQAA